MSVTSSSTVVGVFGNRAVAEQAMEALSRAGFEREEMRYLVPGSSGGFFEDLKSFFTGNDTTPAPGSEDLVSDFTQMGISNEVARYYSQLYNQGHAILAVKTTGDEQMALNILQQYGALNLSGGSGSTTAYDKPQLVDENAQQQIADAQNPVYIDDTPEYIQEQHSNAEYGATPASVQTNTNPDLIETPDYGATYQGNEDTPEQEREEAEISSGSTGQQVEEVDEVETPNYTPYQSGMETSQAEDLSDDHAYRLQQLQAQVLATRQQLQAAKSRLDTVKQHESELQAAQREFQELQTELQATRTELQDAQKRIAQYQI